MPRAEQQPARLRQEVVPWRRDRGGASPARRLCALVLSDARCRASGWTTTLWAISARATQLRRWPRRSTRSRLRSAPASFSTSLTAVRLPGVAYDSLRAHAAFTRPTDVSYKLGLHLEQDPLLYTEGTEFLMPGPLGNLYQVPMNLKVRMMLQLQARKAFDIYRSVNFPRPPADFLVRARLHRRQRLRLGRRAAPSCRASSTGPDRRRQSLTSLPSTMTGERAERGVPTHAQGCG